MPLFFAATLFVSALLLFLVQPMVGKMVLPLLGGTPAVWNTCMVVFQGLLLGGSLYVHATGRWLSVRRQAILHMLVMLVPLALMGAAAAMYGRPVVVARSLVPHGSDYPFFGTVLVLLATIGVPFFVVSTSAPLLQRWFSMTGHKNAGDPYFLYAASNLGSLLALVAYPALVEPTLKLADQGWLWAGGYAALVACVAACAVLVWRVPTAALAPLAPASARDWGRDGDPAGKNWGPTPNPAANVTAGRRFRWLLLALAPSSLMLGVTSHLSTDVAPIPLLWVVPLGLYLLTFVIAFNNPPRWLGRVNGVIAPVLIVVLLFVFMADTKPRFGVAIALHLISFFSIALQCHLELVALRPDVKRLTEFYLVMSLGGVLGGLLNALVSPLVFNALHEYPLALILAGALMPADDDRDSHTAITLDWLLPALFAVAAYLLVRYLPSDGMKDLGKWLATWRLTPISGLGNWLKAAPETGKAIAVYGAGVLACYFGVERPIRFGVGLLGLFVVSVVAGASDPRHLIHQERSFFGVMQVWSDFDDDDPDPNTPVDHRLVHGTTLHGKQHIVPPSDEPLTYYHREGPVGTLFANLPAAKGPDLGFIGLGTGTLAAYGTAGQRVTYYEIDTAIQRIATDPKYFRFYTDCPSEKRIVLGDARLKLEEAADGAYDLLLVDAFSSDAIPVHLLTREAVALYFRKLKPGGAVGVHVSNRYMTLDKVVARIAAEAGYAARVFSDESDESVGKQSSTWIALARSDADFGPLATATVRRNVKVDDDGNRDWRTILAFEPLKSKPTYPLWTDDFSNILSVFDKAVFGFGGGDE